MIKFFRRIRQQLLTENKFSRYLIYAIGEILLVVIGILLALQINNWNENQKQQHFANKLLLDIKTSLINNYVQLNFVIDYNKEGIASAEIILNHLNNNLAYHDSLDLHLLKALDTAYNQGWLETLVFRQENYFFSTASPILTELFETVAMRTKTKPFEYEKLSDSRKYYSILNTMNEYRKDQNIWYSDHLQKLIELEKMIDEKLKIL